MSKSHYYDYNDGKFKPFPSTTPKKDKPTHGNLLWIYGGKTHTILENHPFALINHKKKQLQKQPQYKNGTFKITYK
jgi:hypothetical protein